jgi:hypothetical protein
MNKKMDMMIEIEEQLESRDKAQVYLSQKGVNNSILLKVRLH